MPPAASPGLTILLLPTIGITAGIAFGGALLVVAAAILPFRQAPP